MVSQDLSSSPRVFYFEVSSSPKKIERGELFLNTSETYGFSDGSLLKISHAGLNKNSKFEIESPESSSSLPFSVFNLGSHTGYIYLGQKS